MSDIKPATPINSNYGQLDNGCIVELEDHSVGYALNNTGLERQPFSNWHPLALFHLHLDSMNSKLQGGGNLVGSRTKYDEYPTIINEEELSDITVFEWEVLNAANPSSFWSLQGHLLEINCACPYFNTVQIQYGVTGWGRMFQLVNKSTVGTHISDLPLPGDDHFNLTFGEPAESTYSNGGYTKEDWLYFAENNTQELDMHIEGPLDYEWWDYGPMFGGKIYALSPTPAHWETFSPRFNSYRFLFAQELLGLSNDFVMCGYDLFYYLRNPPPSSEFPQDPVAGQTYPESLEDIGVYTATETWQYTTETEDDKTFYVFTVQVSSSSPYIRGDYSEPVEYYREWPLDNVRFSLRSETRFKVYCLFRQSFDNGNTFDQNVSYFELILDGDPIIFTYSQEVTAGWFYGFGGWRETYQILETRTASCTENINDDRAHYFGIRLEGNDAIFPVTMLIGSVITDQTISIAKLAGANTDSHIYSTSEGTCLVLWDFATKPNESPKRSYFFSQEALSEVLFSRGNDPEEGEQVNWAENQWVCLYPPTQTWDPWDYFIDVDGCGNQKVGDTDLFKRSSLILSVFKEGYKYQEEHAGYNPPSYILEDPSDPESDKIYDIYEATLQVIYKEGTLFLFAGLGSIDQYDIDSEEENPYPITVEHSFDKSFQATIINNEGSEVTEFYFSGETKIKRRHPHYQPAYHRISGFFVTGAQCFLRLYHR